MAHGAQCFSPTEWLQKDEEFPLTQKVKVDFIYSVVSGQTLPSKFIIISDRLFCYRYIIRGDTEKRLLELHLSEPGRELKSLSPSPDFKLDLPLSSQCFIKFPATNGQVVMAQVTSHPTGMTAAHCSSYLLDLATKTVKSLPDMTLAADCVLNSSVCLYRIQEQPSLATRLDLHTLLKSVVQLTCYKEWATSICFDPRPDCSHTIAFITCAEQPWSQGCQGYATLYDLQTKQIICLNHNLLVSSELFQYTPGGHSIVTHKKHPTSLILLSSHTLEQLFNFEYPEYCPFMNLPFQLPAELDTLLSLDPIQRLPSAKVAVRQEALDIFGLRLRQEAAVLLFPVFSTNPNYIGIVHINLGKPATRSKIEVYNLKVKKTKKN